MTRREDLQNMADALAQQMYGTTREELSFQLENALVQVERGCWRRVLRNIRSIQGNREVGVDEELEAHRVWCRQQKDGL